MRTWSRYAYTALISAVLAFALGVIYLNKDGAVPIAGKYTIIPRAVPVTARKQARKPDPFRALRGLALADETSRLKNEESLVLRRLNGERIEDLIDLSKPPRAVKAVSQKPKEGSERTSGGIREIVLTKDFQDNDIPASALEHKTQPSPLADSGKKISLAKLNSVPDESNLDTSAGDDSAFISVDRAALWSGPGKDHSLIGSAGRYSRLSVEMRSGEWYRVKMPSGLRAWVESSDLRFAGTVGSLSSGVHGITAATN